jgi:phospholipase C
MNSLLDGRSPLTRAGTTALTLTLPLLLPGCVGASSAFSPPTIARDNVDAGLNKGRNTDVRSSESVKIKHIIIIVQENRTPDNLFRGLPGADTIPDKKMTPVSLKASYDLNHAHPGFVRQYNGGLLNGFPKKAFGYVPRDEVAPYFEMAESYAFADRMFQSNQGPSFPAHQYILSGTSTITYHSDLKASENPPDSKYGGCDSPSWVMVKLIDPAGSEDHEQYPCYERPALSDLLDAKGLTWRYYQHHLGSGIWNAPDAIRSVRYGAQYASSVIAPPQKILTDIRAGNLANVSWVTPLPADSDHAGENNGTGPSWVAAVVNTLGKSKYWHDTAIFITWDDWGGWYDSVPPPLYNSYELGFRVPLVVISPYTPKGYVSHVQHEFGSILKFAEQTFGLGSLGATDMRADNLMDCFDFTQTPRAFTRIKAPLSTGYFLTERDWGRYTDDY